MYSFIGLILLGIATQVIPNMIQDKQVNQYFKRKEKRNEHQ